MKSGTTGRKVGPLKTMNGFHADNAPLELKVLVGLDTKHVSGMWWHFESNIVAEDQEKRP